MEQKGTVAQVLGPVVDVTFASGALPEINEALTVPINGTDQVMEVAQHVGGDTVRCIMLSPSEGLGRGVEVTATGHTIETPVGEETLGRMVHPSGPSVLCPAEPNYRNFRDGYQSHRPIGTLRQRR